MRNSSLKRFLINQLPTNPGQIIAGSFVDGVATIHYNVVGKLYTDFYAVIGGVGYPLGGTASIPASSNDTNTRLVTQIGLGFQNNYGIPEPAVPTTGPIAYYDPGGATWTFEPGGTANAHSIQTGLMVA